MCLAHVSVSYLRLLYLVPVSGEKGVLTIASLTKHYPLSAYHAFCFRFTIFIFLASFFIGVLLAASCRCRCAGPSRVSSCVLSTPFFHALRANGEVCILCVLCGELFWVLRHLNTAGNSRSAVNPSLFSKITQEKRLTVRGMRAEGGSTFPHCCCLSASFSLYGHFFALSRLAPSSCAKNPHSYHD